MANFVPHLAELPNSVVEVFNFLKSSTPVQEALGQIKQEEQLVVDEQVTLTEVESPPFHEDKRAAFFADKLKQLGLKDVRIDAEGNVIGIRPGSGNGPRLVLGAHLDTVFPASTKIQVTREGNIYRAPGISDDARGLAVLLEVLRVLQAKNISTVGDLLFVGSVGEEGNGDLRGTKHLFNSGEEHIDGFISIDGVNISRLLHGSTGSTRYRAIYDGPGGHSWKAFGNPSALHALGRAIAKIAEVQVPKEPKTSFTVGTACGGTTVNSITASAEMDIDMRSISNQNLENLVKTILPLLEEAAEEENRRWDAKEPDVVKLKLVPIGSRPAGDQPDDSPVLLAARGAMEALGIPLKSYDCASTDQNVAISLGIPATTLGGGGSEGNNHNVKEWYDSTNSFLGPQLAFLTVLALLGVEGETKPILIKHS